MLSLDFEYARTYVRVRTLKRERMRESFIHILTTVTRAHAQTLSLCFFFFVTHIQ